MMEQVRLCCLAHVELAWLILEPDTRLEHCPRILLSCFRARISGSNSDHFIRDDYHSMLYLFIFLHRKRKVMCLLVIQLLWYIDYYTFARGILDFSRP